MSYSSATSQIARSVIRLDRGLLPGVEAAGATSQIARSVIRLDIKL